MEYDPIDQQQDKENYYDSLEKSASQKIYRKDVSEEEWEKLEQEEATQGRELRVYILAKNGEEYALVFDNKEDLEQNI